MDASERVEISGLKIDPELHALVETEILPGTGVEAAHYWDSLSRLIDDLQPKNRQLLNHRDTLQTQLDEWHREHRDNAFDVCAYRQFLTDIGYLQAEGDDFTIDTTNVDPEVAQIAGPQLVVPVDNARYALNAANARWASLYDALYGTDVIPRDDSATGTDYDPQRGAQVIAYSEQFLDRHFPLASGKHSEVSSYSLQATEQGHELAIELASGEATTLADNSAWVGYLTDGDSLSVVLLVHHKLHVEIQIDRQHPIGKEHAAGVKDILLESAITTIQDCEDSVSAVDAADKIQVYRNWLGIMKGTLEATFTKSGKDITRSLQPDRTYLTPSGETITLPGRSMLLVRNVGIHMYTDAVTTSDDEPIPEGFLDAMITAAAAMHDLQASGSVRNSKCGSIYIVKPKLHGPEEVAATVELFGRVETALGLSANTIKIGIMDEERRTSVNLKECIRQARNRVVFINTGFLDRTGDDIHSTMECGPMMPKMEIKNATWILAYEDANVDTGIATGLPGTGQIGKGMWTMPDRMSEMVDSKIGHPQSGATCAWVPSPTAATLHAMHYHQIDVPARQLDLAQREHGSVTAMLQPALAGDRTFSPEEIQRELDNNIQGILGYVVRWVDQGVGCSKVLDIHDIGLMEDRATLRISSQHVANWLHQGIATRAQIEETFRKMAAVVDQQNSSESGYRAMAQDYDGSTAFQAARDLVFEGKAEPNGYTERVLTTRRRQVKSAARA
ncbi:MAG: malate synthase G [Planctomycetaceae bacterium]|nr:malate synthase G [Planctomycetaceae bacterium]